MSRFWSDFLSIGMSIGVALLFVLSARSVRAQVVGATLSGTVKDASGAAVPNVQVAARNVATGTVRNVTTDAAGFYTLPNLIPDTYEVTYSATGFKTQVSSGVNLTVGAQQVLNAELSVGEISQRVEVTGEAPIVELASSAISGQISASTVRELPLNGRSWTDLATLSPGVNSITTQPSFSVGADRGNRGFGQQLTISGARPQQNNYRLDGVSLNDYANGAPGSVMGGNLGVDAIREFSVLTSNYSAEYGKTSGGVINATTRSGTNGFHGSAYEFLRNSAFDARNFFEQAGTAKAPFRRNQFGGAIGGPIIKDKTFFFVDYEGIRYAKGVPNIDFVPSPNARNGILSTGTVSVDPEVQKYLALYPVPAPCGQDVCPYNFNGTTAIVENFVTARIDHKFSDKDSIFGTFVYDKTPYQAPDSFDNVYLQNLTSRQIAAVEETHTFSPTLVNAVRFGFNRDYVLDNTTAQAINPAAADASLGAFPNRDAAYVKVTGLTDMNGGKGGLPTYIYDWDSYQAYDDAFLTKGTHAIKFGAAFERMLLQASALTDPNGIWIFPDLPSFLTNNPSKFQGGVASSLTPRNIRQSMLGLYIQDDWRVRPSLTVNLGLRWEMTTIPTETDGKFVNLRNISDALPVCGAITPSVASSCAASPGPIFSTNPTLHNFEPRIGFAWDALHNGRLAVRGGAGMFDVLPLPYQFTLLETQAIPFFQYDVFGSTPAGSFPFVSNLPPATSSTSRTTYIESSPKRNYVGQWNLSAQYALSQDWAVMVAYIGSRGVHMPYRVDEANLVIPTLTSAGYLWPNPIGSGTPINPNFGSVRGMFYQGMSYYNAFEAQVSKKLSRGFQLQGVFTWAKSMDTSSATVAGDAFGNSISSLDWFDTRLTRALSDFNVGRTFTLSGTWDVPSPKSLSGFAKWPLDGWELGTIFTVSDGVPFTPTWGTGSDPAGTLSSDDFAYPNVLRGPRVAAVWSIPAIRITTSKRNASLSRRLPIRHSGVPTVTRRHPRSVLRYQPGAWHASTCAATRDGTS